MRLWWALYVQVAMSIIEEVKESWGWVGVNPAEVVGENDFGNLMIKDTEGKYWRLCPEDVYCEIIAEDRDSLDRLSKDQDFLEDWYMSDLVEQATAEYGPLEAGHKFHLTIPGVLGGEYAVSNIKPVPVTEQIRFSGSIGKQIKELPEGAEIQLKVID